MLCDEKKHRQSSIIVRKLYANLAPSPIYVEVVRTLMTKPSNNDNYT